MSDGYPPPKAASADAPKDGESDLGAAVRKALLEAADMRDIAERVAEVSARISKLTPMPDKKAKGGNKEDAAG